jgi:NAD-dependent dihydropyrimidine dehydrogenase PreA subunit
VFDVIVRADRCENKKTCLEVCPTDVFEMVKPVGVRNPFIRLKIRVHGGVVASPIRENDCIGCMRCVEVCPEDAITVTAAG